MILDYSPRMSGKTTRLIRWLRSEHYKHEEGGGKAIIIVGSVDEKESLIAFLHKTFDKKEAIELSHLIFSVLEYTAKREQGMLRNKKLGVDNAEYVLERLLNVKIERATVSINRDLYNEN